MRKIFTAFLLALCVPIAVSGCSVTTESVRMTTDKAFLTTQVAFHSMQQIALAGIKSGAISGTRKNQIIDLIAKGQAYENTAYQTRNDVSINALADVIQALANLGIGKA